MVWIFSEILNNFEIVVFDLFKAIATQLDIQLLKNFVEFIWKLANKTYPNDSIKKNVQP